MQTSPETTPRLSLFVEMLVERHNVTVEEAQKIESVYRREKILKYDVVAGGFTIIHSAFLEPLVLRNAIEAAQ